MPDLTIFNPGYDVQCKQCSEVGPGVILRKVGDPRNFSALCGRCLALALSEATHADYLSQYTTWEAMKEFSRQVQEEKRRGTQKGT